MEVTLWESIQTSLSIPFLHTGRLWLEDSVTVFVERERQCTPTVQLTPCSSLLAHLTRHEVGRYLHLSNLASPIDSQCLEVSQDGSRKVTVILWNPKGYLAVLAESRKSNDLFPLWTFLSHLLPLQSQEVRHKANDKWHFVHMMYHVEYQKTRERRFTTLCHLWKHCIWFRAVLLALSEVKDHLPPNPSWVGVWSYSSRLIHGSYRMQFHPTFTTLRRVCTLFNETWPLTWPTCSQFLYLLHTSEKQFTAWHHTVETMGLGVPMAWLNLSSIAYLLMCVTWAIYFTPLCLSFLICEMVTKTILTLSGCCEN